MLSCSSSCKVARVSSKSWTTSQSMKSIRLVASSSVSTPIQTMTRERDMRKRRAMALRRSTTVACLLVWIEYVAPLRATSFTWIVVGIAAVGKRMLAVLNDLLFKFDMTTHRRCRPLGDVGCGRKSYRASECQLSIWLTTYSYLTKPILLATLQDDLSGQGDPVTFDQY